MTRRILALATAVAAVVLGVWGCQDYNFNPVGSCIIQPGSRQVRLDDVSVADVLFVVDDSGSMAGEQQNLSRNFGAFIFALAKENRARVASDLKPLEFHLAVTTSSVFRIRGTSSPTESYAYSDKYDDVVNPADHGCTADASCTAANIGRNTASCAGAGSRVCGRAGQCCSCVPGAAVSGQAYPKGDFVTAGTNPKVLHFTQSLPWTSWGCVDDAACTATTVGDPCGAPGSTCGSAGKCCAPLCTADAACTQVGAACGAGGVCGAVNECCAAPPAAIQALIDQFKQNVQVGTCGSAQEQHLQAARLAVQKALAGQQPGVAAGEWPHAGAKLVVAVVGDEDDCSNPPPTCVDPARCTPAEVAGSISINDPTGATGLCSGSLETCEPALPNTCPSPQSCTPIIGLSGFDGCTYDQALPAAQQKAYTINDLYAFFAGLGKPLGSAFVVSTQDGSCQYADFGATCQPGICCDTVCTGGACTSIVCGGQAAGRRLLQAATRFRAARPNDTVAGNICDQQFDRTLANIANLVKTPSALTLDSVPAASDMAIVRIADSSSGATRRICTQAATQAEADSHTFGWWFADCPVLTTPPPLSTAPTKCVFIDHASGECEANPGETYSAEYLGQLPPGGCTGASPTVAPSPSCAQALPAADGGPSDANDWWCYGPAGGTGTCVCSANAP
ncbi:MAG TPA: hypothetical protein VFI16_02275 [Anaeromyxobacteraceae bacterium]|nr:hypothetical protein [Anaeromyxobacteraceae bacterium]